VPNVVFIEAARQGGGDWSDLAGRDVLPEWRPVVGTIRLGADDLSELEKPVWRIASVPRRAAKPAPITAARLGWP
jgi:hypothetical protein